MNRVLPQRVITLYFPSIFIPSRFLPVSYAHAQTDAFSGKQIIQNNVGVDHAAVLVLLQAECGDHGCLNGLFCSCFLNEGADFIAQDAITVFVDGTLFRCILDFTEIDHMVIAVNDKINLGAAVVLVSPAEPGRLFRQNAGNAKLLLDLPDMVFTELLKSESCQACFAPLL